MSNTEATVLYDEDCGFCKWSLDKILAWDRLHELQPMPIQSEEGQRLLADVPVAQRLDSWHLVDSAGEVHSAGAGFGTLFDILPGASPLAVGVRKFPHATECAYRAVADNRTRLAKLLRIDASCAVRR
ncbi:MAG: DCC1-like thiol-disulfide oxidoreductase family protein [Solirubrobacterales bacterium]